MRRVSASVLVVAALTFLSSGVGAEEAHCKLYPKGGLLAESYDLVGVDACKAFCTDTDGCTAWSYTPHNFNPQKAPGWCRLMAEPGDEEASDRDFCGRV